MERVLKARVAPGAATRRRKTLESRKCSLCQLEARIKFAALD